MKDQKKDCLSEESLDLAISKNMCLNIKKLILYL